MFSLILVTILSGVCLGQQGLESAAAASASASSLFGYGSGGLGYSNGYGTRYGYTPQSHFSNGYGGYSNMYTPGTPNSFVPFVRSSLSPTYSPQIGSYSTSYRNIHIPQPYFYQNQQRYTNPSYPNLTPVSQVPVVPSVPYYSIPYFESIESFRFYNSLNKNKSQSGLHLDSRVEMNNNNKTSNNTNNEESIKEETTSEAEPVLQLTYLGYVPQPSFFRSTSESVMVDEAPRRIPFYMLDYDEPTGIPRSSSASPTIYVSPNRLLPSSSSYPTTDIGYTGSIVSPIGSNSPGFSSHDFSSINPVSNVASVPVVSPYRSAEQINPYFYRSTSPDESSGYYLIDVEPVPRYNARLSSGPILGAPRPTIPPYIQTLTGPMGGPMTEFLRPGSNSVNSNTQSQSGFYKGGENVNKVENQNFNTGFQTQLPHGQAYSNFQSNKELSVQKFDGRGEQGFNTGYGSGSQSFGTSGLLG